MIFAFRINHRNLLIWLQGGIENCQLLKLIKVLFLVKIFNGPIRSVPMMQKFTENIKYILKILSYIEDSDKAMGWSKNTVVIYLFIRSVSHSFPIRVFLVKNFVVVPELELSSKPDLYQSPSQA